MEKGLNIKWISKNKDGNYYIGHEIEVSRGIKGKSKGKVTELLIIGLHKDNLEKFCIDNNLDYKKIKEVIG